MMLLVGLGGSGGKLLGVIASKARGDWFGVLVTGENGRFKNVETSRRSLVGVSLIGSRAVTRRPVDDLGFSIVSEEDGAKRPLDNTWMRKQIWPESWVAPRNGRLRLNAPFPSAKKAGKLGIVFQRVLVAVEMFFDPCL
jgi:hypothetical protein